eukprot:3260376-Amphidinium_carterae.1
MGDLEHPGRTVSSGYMVKVNFKASSSFLMQLCIALKGLTSTLEEISSGHCIIRNSTALCTHLVIPSGRCERKPRGVDTLQLHCKNVSKD